MDKPQTTELPEAVQQEYETKTYEVECPECGDYLQEYNSMENTIQECMCGAKFKVTL